MDLLPSGDHRDPVSALIFFGTRHKISKVASRGRDWPAGPPGSSGPVHAESPCFARPSLEARARILPQTDRRAGEFSAIPRRARAAGIFARFAFRAAPSTELVRRHLADLGRGSALRSSRP